MSSNSNTRNAPEQSQFSIQLTNYPSSILLGNRTYSFNFNAVHYGSTPEKYIIKIYGDDFDILGRVPENIEEGIEFSPNENKTVTINLKPKKDGVCKLFIQVIWQKVVKYTVMVWKVKKKIEKELIDHIYSQKLVVPVDLDKYRSELPKTIDNKGVEIIDRTAAEKKLEELNQPPPPVKVEKQVKKQVQKEVPQPPIIDPKTGEEIPQPPKIVVEEIVETVVETVPGTPLTDEQKDVKLLEIARGVFMNDPAFGYEVLKKISNKELMNTWLYHFIPTGILLDYKTTLSIVMDIKDPEKKEQFFQMIAYGIGPVDPNDALMVALNLQDSTKRDNLIKDLILSAVNHGNIEFAFNAVYQINDKDLQNRVLFEVIKLAADKDQQKAVDALKSMITNILSGSNKDFIITCMILLAHLTSPQAVYDLIDNFGDNERSFLQEQLQGYLKVQTEEQRTRIDPTIVYNTYLMFTAATSELTPSLERLVDLNGLISPNLLNPAEEGRKISVLVIAPFSYSFPVAYLFQNIYFTLTDKKRNLAYIFFPMRFSDAKSEEDWQYFKEVFKKYIERSGNLFDQSTDVFILDFIPYLSKSSIFLSPAEDGELSGSISGRIELIKNKLKSLEGDLLYLDTQVPFFTGGEIGRNIRDITPVSPKTIINVIFTYNLINQYDLLNNVFKLLMD